MASELSPEHDALVDALVSTGLYSDRRQVLGRALELLREEAETVKAIREGLESIERGEGTPLEEAENELRAKYWIRSDS
jgi:Arc/MetJ-type ribon-helix-helix transcriptional regulator